MGRLIAVLAVALCSLWIHELAHSIAALIRGCIVTSIVVGHGPVLWQGRIGRVGLELRLVPLTVRTRFRWRNARRRMADLWIAVGAGPLANLLAGLAALPAVESFIGAVVVASNLGIVLTTLFLPEAHVEGEMEISDGAQLRRLLGSALNARSWGHRWRRMQPPDVQSVVELARESAVQRGSGDITVEDVLAGLAGDRSGCAGVVLRRAGLSAEAVMRALNPTPRAGSREHPPRPAVEVRLLMRQARDATVQPPVPVLCSLHLLLAITLSPGRPGRMLARHDIDEGTVREALAEWQVHVGRATDAAAELRAGDYRAAEWHFRTLLSWRLLPPEGQAAAHSQLGWAILMNDPQRAGEALEISTAAMSLAQSTAIQATHAYALVEAGSVAEGLELNRQVLELTLPAAVRATHECVRAIGLASLGRLDEAEALLHTARRRWSGAELRDRAEERIAEARASTTAPPRGAASAGTS